MNSYTFFATCPFYLEELLKDELESIGGTDIQIAHGGAGFSGSIETAYRACLWSRIANRILFPLVSFDVESPDDIRKAAESFEWENHFAPDSTLAVDSTLTKTKVCTPDYAALSVKDGIVDRARNLSGRRPDIDTKNPDIRLHLHVTLKRGGIALDMSGEGLHKRGYRLETVKAGIRENTAAAVLIRAGWADMPAGSFFLDPMCGSGTLVTEAALIAADIAPAINRRRFGFEKWLHHSETLWNSLTAEAAERKAAGITALKNAYKNGAVPLFTGRDNNPKAVTAARTNIRGSAAAELYSAGIISIERGDFFKQLPPENPGLLAVNPPYGERLNKDDDMLLFYRKMGEIFKRVYGGWKIALLTGHRELSDSLGMRADKINTVYNGGIRCTLSHFRIFSDRPEESNDSVQNGEKGEKTTDSDSMALTGRGYPSFEELSPGAQMIYNRLKKNAKRLKSWLKTERIECYRLYDADMPEYSVAVDIYPPEAVVQEYAAPKTIDPVAASGRLREAVLAVQAWLELPEDMVKIKKRKKQRGSSQYEKSGSAADISGRRILSEHGLKFFIDTSSYLDTGIFLDSRPIRKLIRNEAKGKSFLNLFCYTGTATAYAADGGALSTTSVDASKTYLDWAEANMKLNGFRTGNSFVRDDCLTWLKSAVNRWDFIYLDPPTFSNSKSRTIFDLQKDHEELVRLAVSRLAPDGLLLFCNNFRKFKMSPELENDLDITEISDRTIDPDFERRKTIHRCWRIKPRKT